MPPEAETRQIPCAPCPKKIVSSAPQLTPKGLLAAPRTIGAPPATDTRFS